MTTLVAWIGVDSRRPSSAYIASDSRLSWPTGGTWDSGKKTFASSVYPDVAGFWGDVLFPTTILGQHFAILDSCVAPEGYGDPTERIDHLYHYLRQACTGIPTQQSRPFAIVYIARRSQGMRAEFETTILSYNSEAEWTRREISEPAESAYIVLRGSGAGAFEIASERWQQSSSAGTSRSVYGTLVDGLKTQIDPKSGGAPQLVGIYRIGTGMHFGIVHDGRRFLNGCEIPYGRSLALAVEWRNELFERVSPKDLSLLPSAQEHQRPLMS